MSLLDYARDAYSQNGDDGIVDRIFSVIGTDTALCCEFGAWDGIHFSNTRELIERGWRAVMIEADPSRFADLERNYGGNPRVTCVRAVVDDGEGRLEKVLRAAGVAERLDFLSIDIDGLDYYVFAALAASPRCIAVEVNAGHPPEREDLLPRALASRNVGQPLGAFVRKASDRGYRLVGYNGNAYFVHQHADEAEKLPEVGAVEAYEDFLGRLSQDARLWLYRVNRGLAPPHHRYDNPRLRRRALRLPAWRAGTAAFRGALSRIRARAARSGN